MKRHLERKQCKLLNNALDVMAAELADVGDSFRQEKWCSAHAQMQSIQRACSVKVWCTKIALILKVVVQTGANLAGWSGN